MTYYILAILLSTPKVSGPSTGDVLTSKFIQKKNLGSVFCISHQLFLVKRWIIKKFMKIHKSLSENAA